MDRINTPNAVPDGNGPGKRGFRDGNKALGILATEFDAAFCNGLQEEIAAVIESEGIALDDSDNAQLLAAIEAKIAAALSDQYITQLAAGDPLPGTDIGPIWHAGFNSLMTVQAFTANGAAYTGYASVLIGSILADTQPTPRTGYVKSGTSNLSRTTYAALRAWAMHNGLMVASGLWVAGSIVVCDNPDGTTFKIFDVRSEFPRYWDDARGIDASRLFGSWQKGTLIPIDTPVAAVWGLSANVDGQPSQPLAGVDDYTASNYTGMTLTGIGSGVTSAALKGDAEGWSGVARPNNVALLASVKF